MALSAAQSAYIDEHRVAHLATADARGAPHVIPIVYARVEQTLYFIVDEKPKRTRRGLKRLVNIAQNPEVALVIDDYDEDWTRLAYMLIEGRAVTVTDPNEFAKVLVALRERFPQYVSMPLCFDSHPMVCISPRRTTLWRAADGHNFRP